MPLDTQLFAGVSSDLLLNIVATRGLDKTDFRKFDFDKYDIAFRSMERVFQKIPESRIFQDCGRWRELFAKIIAAKGCKLNSDASTRKRFYSRTLGMKARIARLTDFAKDALHESEVWELTEGELAKLDLSEDQMNAGDEESYAFEEGGEDGGGEGDADGERLGDEDLARAGGAGE